jgi:hypothetical protein
MNAHLTPSVSTRREEARALAQPKRAALRAAKRTYGPEVAHRGLPSPGSATGAFRSKRA